MSEPLKTRAAYRPDIDGLRAIAVLAVVFYHAGFTRFFGGGYVGVDIFFVISGYLISGILYRECTAGTFSLSGFYERRIRRIVPAFFVMCVLGSVAACVIMMPEEFKQHGKSLLRAALCMANLFFMKQTGGYFDAPAHGYPLLHTWSLSVEEQFYFIFPLLFFAIMKFARKWVVPVCGGILLLSFLAACFLVGRDQPFTFYMLPTRAWELMCGAMLAISPLPHISDKNKNWLLLLGVLLIFSAVTGYGFLSGLAFPGLAALPPCLGAVLCVLGGAQRERAGVLYGLLSCRPVVFVGLISYSLYLWHWPLFVLYQGLFLNGEISFAAAWVLIGLSLLLAVLSWAFVETPFRQKRLLKRRAHMILAGLLALGLLALGGKAIYRSWIPALISEGGYAEGIHDIWKFSPENDPPLAQAMFPQRTGFFGDREKRPDIFVLGDSHAEALGKVLDLSGKEHGKSGFLFFVHPPFLGATCKIFPDDQVPPHQLVRDFVQEHRPETLLISARYAVYSNSFLSYDANYRDRLNYTISYLTPDGRNITDPVQAMDASLRDMMDFFRENGVKRCYILLPIPEHGVYVPHAAAKLDFWGMDVEQRVTLPVAVYLDRQKDVLPVLRGLQENNPDFVTLLDPLPALCPDGQNCDGVRNGRSLYYDDDHLSNAGAMELKEVLRPVFEAN